MKGCLKLGDVYAPEISGSTVNTNDMERGVKETGTVVNIVRKEKGITGGNGVTRDALAKLRFGKTLHRNIGRTKGLSERFCGDHVEAAEKEEEPGCG